MQSIMLKGLWGLEQKVLNSQCFSMSQTLPEPFISFSRGLFNFLTNKASVGLGPWRGLQD